MLNLYRYHEDPAKLNPPKTPSQGFALDHALAMNWQVGQDVIDAFIKDPQYAYNYGNEREGGSERN